MSIKLKYLNEIIQPVHLRRKQKNWKKASMNFGATIASPTYFLIKPINPETDCC